jgi:hypothetical protein
LLQVFATVEVVALQHILDASVEPLHHAVGLGPHLRGEAMFDTQIGTQAVELVCACSGPFAQTEQAIGELFPIIRENVVDPHRAGTLQIAQEAPGIGRRFCAVDADEHPPRGAVNGHKQVAVPVLVGHLGQVFHVYMHEPRLIGLERFVRWLGGLFPQIAQVADAVSAQAPIQTRARDVGV